MSDPSASTSRTLRFQVCPTMPNLVSAGGSNLEHARQVLYKLTTFPSQFPFLNWKPRGFI